MISSSASNRLGKCHQREAILWPRTTAHNSPGRCRVVHSSFLCFPENEHRAGPADAEMLSSYSIYQNNAPPLWEASRNPDAKQVVDKATTFHLSGLRHKGNRAAHRR